jgi:hypothetical protein
LHLLWCLHEHKNHQAEPYSKTKQTQHMHSVQKHYLNKTTDVENGLGVFLKQQNWRGLPRIITGSKTRSDRSDTI